MSEESKNFEEGTQEKIDEFYNDGYKDEKTIAIIAHMFFIGWIIALIMNNKNKDAYASFYIRQVLGIMILAFICSFVPVIGWIANIGVFILWVISLIGAVSGELRHIPFFGKRFQEWFNTL